MTLPDPDNRREVHNASIDTEMAYAHFCGLTDLRTGRICVKPARHDGPCDFREHHEAKRQLHRDSAP